MGEHTESEALFAYPAASYFKAPGANFIAAYGYWIIAAAWLVARGAVIGVWGLMPDGIVESYFQIAGDWLDGYAPYRDFNLAYPPAALLWLALPGIFTESAAAYGYGLASLVLVTDLVILLMLIRVMAWVFAGDKDRDDTKRRYQATLLCLIYILFTTFFGPLLFRRYDLVLALLLIGIVDSSLRNKNILADVLLAVAVGFNLTAIIWIPFAWCCGCFRLQDDDGVDKSAKMNSWAGGLLPRSGVLAIALGVLFGPFILTAGRSLGSIFTIYLDIGLLIDSAAAAILMVVAKLNGIELGTDTTLQLLHLTGNAGRWGAIVSALVTVLAIVVMSVRMARPLREPADAVARGIRLIRGLLAITLALLALTPALSPQFAVWVMPLAALCTLAGQAHVRAAGWNLFSAVLMTTVLSNFYQAELGQLQLLPAVIVLGRSALILRSAFLLLRPDMAAEDQQAQRPSDNRFANRFLIRVSTALLFAWGTLAAFCPVSSNDLWLLLREAMDIVASGGIPRVEQYSAVAFGRPYLAHEWLSGLVFLGVYNLGGGEALTVLRASVMLAMLFLLWYSLEKEDRGFVLVIPLLALAAYTILIRVFVRPHLFTHLFVCVWVFCLAHWRRERRLHYLIALVPIQVLWANLHGAYIFAPVIGTTIAGVLAIHVLFPGWTKNERYTWKDVNIFAVLAIVCLAVSLINPNGARLLEFSLGMGLGSDYIKEFVYEWANPFGPRYAQSYGREAAVCMILLVWLGLALNVKRRPLWDVVVALLATAMTVQAVRFLSFIGMLGFPIVVRAWRQVAENWIEPRYTRRRPLIESAFILILLASTLIYGFPYGPAKHRQIGWGLGGRVPHEVVRYITEHGLEGAMFNDYADGAFIIYHLTPKVRPVMDSRIDVYGDNLYREYFLCRRHPVTFFRYLNKYDVSMVLLRKSEDNLQINQYLDYIPATKLLLETEYRLLFSYDPALLPEELKKQINQ
jgi:hypothetical protein